MNIVFQENDFDCSAACLAMALGMLRSSDTYPLLGYNPATRSNGVYDIEVTSALHRMGKRYHAETTKEEMEALGYGSDFENCLGIPRRLDVRDKLASMQTGCAIVGVPSLNREGVYHSVFVKRGEAYDPRPAPFRRYVGTAYSLPVMSVIYILD